MAYEVKKINPIDLQPRKAVGVSLPFSGKAVFNQTFETKEAIKTNLINYFLTGKGERFLNPTFGNALQPLLFDQLTEDKVKEIDSIVKTDIARFFPKVEPTEISTIGDPDTNTVQFFLRYKIKNTEVEDEVAINFYN